MLLAAQVWHYWIGFVLAISAVAVTLALVVGYVAKVKAPQYRPENQEFTPQG
ncbi:MAG TPA: hypothetical protein VF855_00825 [Acidimicrobiales bacterium]